MKLARKLAQLPGILATYSHHPWYGCLLKSWSMQLQGTVLSHFEGFRTVILVAGPLSTRAAELIQVPAPDSIAALNEMLSTVRLYCSSPAPPTSWMQHADLHELTGRARDLGVKSSRFHELRSTLDKVYEPSLFHNECRELDCSLNPSSPSILDSIRSSEPRRFLAERGGQLRGWLDTSISALAELRRAASEISSLLEMAAPRTLNECRTIARFALAAATDPRPTETWFDWTTLNRILELAQEANDKSARLINLRDELSKDFAADLFRLPLLAWRTDFGNRYATIWRVFKPDYHRCRKQLHRTRTTSSRLTYVDAREKVAQGAEVLEIDDWFNTRREEHSQLLGFHYRGQGTKWEDVALHAETVRSILEVERGLGPPKQLKAALLNGGVALLRIGAVGKSLADNTRVLENSLRSIEECSDIRALTGSDAVDSCALDSLESRLTEARTWLNEYEDAICIRKIRCCERANREKWMPSRRTLPPLVRRREIERYFVETSSASQDAFCHFYSGLSTDLESRTCFSEVEQWNNFSPTWKDNRGKVLAQKRPVLQKAHCRCSAAIARTQESPRCTPLS